MRLSFSAFTLLAGCALAVACTDGQIVVVESGNSITPTASLTAARTATPVQSPTTAPTVRSTATATPTSPPIPTPTPTPIEDRDCADFGSWTEAERFFKEAGGPAIDVHHLDLDGDGVPCETMQGAQADLMPSPTPTAALPPADATPSPTIAASSDSEGSNPSTQTPPKATGAPFPTASPTPYEVPTGTTSTPTPTTGALLYDPSGEDRDCGDFPTWQEAHDFYLAAGGPDQDPHRLDGNKDGIPCESLPGAPD